MALEDYQRKRRFERTPEPAGTSAPDPGSELRFVIQRHDARRLHYDLRLEYEGVLKSWAVPKGPSLNPADKQLAVQTEDHPVEYLDFDGVIPEGNYGAGVMEIWDQGTYRFEGDILPQQQFQKGDLKLYFEGRKVRGAFALVRMKPRQGSKQTEWLLIKHRDQFVDPDWDITAHDEPLLAHGEDTAALELTPGALEGAVAAEFPDRWQPMLATLVDKPFTKPDWLFELKWDGMRVLIYIRDGEACFVSRNANVCTASFPDLKDLPLHVRAREAVLDGEIVVLEADGTPSFGRLQHRMHVHRPTPALLAADPADIYLFDILYCDGFDLRDVALVDRKALLATLFRAEPPFRYSGHLEGEGEALFRAAEEKQLEGIIAKRKRSKYLAGRTGEWLKIKIVQTLDAVVVGFTRPRGGRQCFGALALALYREEKLEFIGNVGTGFDEARLKAIRAHLEPLAVSNPPLQEVPKLKEEVTWTRPSTVARVTYRGWTGDRRLRHPVFVELRADIDAADCRAEDEEPEPAAELTRLTVRQPQEPVLETLEELQVELESGSRENVSALVEEHTLRFTNLNKVYFPEEKLTKRDLLAHYLRVGPYLLPMLEDRPMVLRRHPNGIHGEAFYQKEIGMEYPDWMPTVEIHSGTKGQAVKHYVTKGLASLLFLTNLGCIEHNPWSSRAPSLETPDYVFFDLDPTDGTDFEVVLSVARHILKLLQDLDVSVFVKTSGASGLHLFLPLEPVYSYDQTRMFAEVVARIAALELGKLTTLERHVAKRNAGQVYLDYSQNAYGRPLASVYSVRPVVAASVSTPLLFQELNGKISPSDFSIPVFAGQAEKRGAIWEPFWEQRQTLDGGLGRLGRLMQQAGRATQS